MNPHSSSLIATLVAAIVSLTIGHADVILVVDSPNDVNSVVRGVRSGSPYNGAAVSATFDLSDGGDSATGLTGTLTVTSTAWYDTGDIGNHFNDDYAGDLYGADSIATWTVTGYVPGTTVTVYGSWRGQNNFASAAPLSINGGPTIFINAKSNGGGGQSVAGVDGLVLADPAGGTEDFQFLGTGTADASGQVQVTLSGAGGYITADAMAFASSTGAAPTGFPLVITPNAPDSRFQLAWASRDGMLYNVRSSADLSAELSTWTSVQGDIPASGTGTNTLDVNPVEAVLFYRVEEFPPPPILSEGFDEDDGGFTMVDHSGGTGSVWMHGDPNSDGGQGGDVLAGNGGSAQCWGTDIGSPGTYATGTDTSLISPVIDLTSVPNAVLSFAQAIDILSGDTLVVNVLDDTTDTVLQAAVHTSSPDPDVNAADWETVSSVAITGGQPVRIEWRFTGNNDGSYIGAYIDDVVVEDTAP